MTDLDRHSITTDGQHIPQDLKDAETPLWVVWDVEEKVALAPWETGHMFRASWSEESGDDPRVEFEKARMVADLPVSEIHRTWPFPDDADLPETIKPTILLPHEAASPSPRYALVDYDDVVVGGSVSAEVWDLLKRFGGPCFLSQSGSGIHQWVRGRLPDGFGKLNADLHEEGSVEIYDHGRMTGETWTHIRGTPTDELPEAAQIIAEVVEEFATNERKESAQRSAKQQNTPRSAADVLDEIEHPGGGVSHNPYYNLDIKPVANRGPFSAHRTDASTGTDNWQGPHPKHGGTTSPDRESKNFNVDPDDGVWHCFAHGDGGSALRLIAVLEGVSPCGSSDRLSTDDAVEVNVNQIRNHFAPTFNVPPQRVNRVLYYLTEIDACNHVEDLTYEFSRDHISEVMSIVQTVRDQRVEEVLDDVDEDHIPDERQTTLDMVSDEALANDGDEEVVDDGEGEEDDDDEESENADAESEEDESQE